MTAVDPSATKDYVTFLLTQEEPRPPITWRNWWSEVYWERLVVMIIMPLCTFVAAYYTPLYANTAIWTMVYYVVSGLSECSGWGSGERRFEY